MENLIKAVNKVMEDCENVDKGLTVGTGKNSYKGVSDKDVKLLVNRSMRKNGLAIFPTGIEKEIQIERYTDNYGNPKQKVFTEVTTKYKLFHTSGESIELTGYGHGVDSQDKSAGKATTYALKYTLLYTFLVATGQIDDTDKTHSEEVTTVTKSNTEPGNKKVDKPFVKADSEKAKDLEKVVREGKKLSEVLKYYRLEKVLETQLKRLEFEIEGDQNK